jgi:hypothetical protein
MKRVSRKASGKPTDSRKEPKADGIKNYTVGFDGQPGLLEIRTGLTKEDLQKLPKLAFHGTPEKGLRFVNEDQEFGGNFVNIRPVTEDMSVEEFFEQLFDGSKSSIDYSIKQVATFVVDESESTDYTRMNDDGLLPAMLIVKTVSPTGWSYEHVGNMDILAIVRMTRLEIDELIEEAVKISDKEYGWKTARSYSIRFGIEKILAQKVVDAIEEIAGSAQDQP